MRRSQFRRRGLTLAWLFLTSYPPMGKSYVGCPIVYILNATAEATCHVAARCTLCAPNEPHASPPFPCKRGEGEQASLSVLRAVDSCLMSRGPRRRNTAG